MKTKTKNRPQLPQPDEYGNYWLGPPLERPDGTSSRTSGPCILVSSLDIRQIAEGKKAGRARYYASRGDSVKGPGILCDKGGIRYFDTPAEAYQALAEDHYRELT